MSSWGRYELRHLRNSTRYIKVRDAIFRNTLTDPATLASRFTFPHLLDFVDGRETCPPAPGIAEFFAPPYLCYFLRHSPPHIESAIDYLYQVLYEDGPFDGIIAFSQGAGLVLSLLQSHRLRRPTDALPFRMAVLIACTIALSPSAEMGVELCINSISGVAGKRAVSLTHDYMQQGSEPPPEAGVLPNIDPTSNDVLSDTNGKTSPYRIYRFPVVSSLPLINIPTVHIYGSCDPWSDESQAAVSLCDPKTARVHVHPGAHTLPREEESLRQCAEQISLVASKLGSPIGK